uniref:Voltage-dependent calcium channel gamma-3 subunit n=2 Tax=Electrophorus electricus TaxID=8005 RepID=A0AAY5EZV5_ELEEL
MRVRNRGAQTLITTMGAFVAFSLMAIAVGTDYWLFSPGVCRTSAGDNETNSMNEEVLTHSGLWRQCCVEGTFTGVCKNIDHFPEDAEYEQDAAEYLLCAVRAYSLFPILSVGLLFVGAVCVAASEVYKRRDNVILSAGIFFVSAGLSNIIGIIVYISANANDPNQGESKRSHWYGWSFYCGALSFIIAETVGVLTVHLFIQTHRELLRAHARHSLQPHAHAPPQLRRSFNCRIQQVQSSPSDLSPGLHGSDLGAGYGPPTHPHDSVNASHGFAHFHNAVIANDKCNGAHVRVLQNSVKSDNGFLINLTSASAEKGFGFFDAHAKTAVKVDNGPVPRLHTFNSVNDDAPTKGHSYSPMSGSATRRTTPV